jgi:hypothetical protein
LQLPHQLQDLRLDRHIDRGRRRVGDQQVRLVGQRHRDHHPLALAAGELVRVGFQPLLGVGQPRDRTDGWAAIGNRLPSIEGALDEVEARRQRL